MCSPSHFKILTMKTAFSIFLLLSSVMISSSQDSKIKFGKISPEDLAMKVYLPDTEAVAVILSKIGHVKFDVLDENNPLTTEIHVVLKFLKDPALDAYGNVRLEYYSYNHYSKISDVKAIVHLPDGTDIKVDNNQIFDEDVNDYYSAKKIAFPKLVPGAIVEYQYVILSSAMFSPVDWFFQSEIPIVYTQLTTSIPEWYEYVVLTQGSPLYQNSQTVTTKPINVNETERITTGYVTKSTTTHNVVNVRFVENTYINKNMPALKEESFITSMENYYSRIRFRLNAVQIPEMPLQPIMNSWSKVAEELYNESDWGGQLKNKHPGELVLEAAGINIASASNQMEIALKMYDYINSHIQWNDMYSYGGRHDINEILKTGSANSGNLNKLMCAALIQAGIHALPILISTRDNGNMLEIYPFVDQFNHMIVLATLDGKDTWIDAGDKNRPLGTLRTESLNSRGWVVDEANPAWIDIKPVDSKSVYFIKGNLDKDGNLNGDLETRFTGYHALQQRTSADEEKEKYGNDLVVCGTNPMKISGMEMINAENVSLPFQLKAKIVNYPVATSTPDRMYISPVFPKGLDEIPFKLEKRTYPIEMNYPSEVNMILDLTIPEGFIVESIPEPIRYVTESGGISVSYSASNNGGRIMINVKYAIKQLFFDPVDYTALKAFYNQRHLKLNEQIVLAKA